MSGSYLESLFGLKGKTALCTGATRGIGKNMAEALAKAGADVILIQVSYLYAVSDVRTFLSDEPCCVLSFSVMRATPKRVMPSEDSDEDAKLSHATLQTRLQSEA